MSDRDNWKVNQLRRLIFEVFDPVTGLAVTGLTQTDFTTAGATVTLLLEAVVPGSPPSFTITEIASGRYKLEYTPNVLGFWYLSVRHPTYNKQGWVDELNAISIAADDPVSVSAGSITSIATAVLTLPLSGIEVSIRGVRCLGSVIQRIRNKKARTAPQTWATYESDGTTVAWSASTLTDPTQKPVVSESPN